MPERRGKSVGCSKHRATERDKAELPTVTVHVPIHFQRRGGRKAVVTSQAQGTVIDQRSTNPFPDPLLSAIARAFYWRKLIDTGTYASIAEIAAAEGVSPSYISRVTRLTLLMPNTVLRLFDSSAVSSLAAMAQPMSVVWTRQTH